GIGHRSGHDTYGAGPVDLIRGEIGDQWFGLPLDLDAGAFERAPRRVRIRYEQVDDAASLARDGAQALDVDPGLAERLAELGEGPGPVLEGDGEVLHRRLLRGFRQGGSTLTAARRQTRVLGLRRRAPTAAPPGRPRRTPPGNGTPRSRRRGSPRRPRSPGRARPVCRDGPRSRRRPPRPR